MLNEKLACTQELGRHCHGLRQLALVGAVPHLSHDLTIAMARYAEPEIRRGDEARIMEWV
jgi:hypothetical protein